VLGSAAAAATSTGRHSILDQPMPMRSEDAYTASWQQHHHQPTMTMLLPTALSPETHEWRSQTTADALYAETHKHNSISMATLQTKPRLASLLGFYLSHSYSMGQIIKPGCLCPCVRLRAPSCSHFLMNIHQNWQT